MNFLHVIAFDIPFPANYGGVIDVFYKLKTLKQKNVKIILHCYEYGRNHAKELEEICHEVYYYRRDNSLKNFFSLTPFIVKSRNSKFLLQNLLQNNHPILFEGLHSCFLLNDSKLSKRTKIVRTHNIEHHYYKNLAEIEKSISKKLYFYIESFKLKLFEKKLCTAAYLAAISKNDQSYYEKIHPNVKLISAFHSNNIVESIEGKGTYVFYHGNLGVGENNTAALYLVNQIFSKIEIPLYIAGNNPSEELITAVSKHKNITLFKNCTSDYIDELIKQAHINILPTFQATGIKLKLLNALYKGRFCLVNPPMVKDTGLEKLCLVGETAEDLIRELKNLMQLTFTPEDIKTRATTIDRIFSNEFNGDNLIELIR